MDLHGPVLMSIYAKHSLLSFSWSEDEASTPVYEKSTYGASTESITYEASTESTESKESISPNEARTVNKAMEGEEAIMSTEENHQHLSNSNIKRASFLTICIMLIGNMSNYLINY